MSHDDFGARPASEFLASFYEAGGKNTDLTALARHRNKLSQCIEIAREPVLALPTVNDQVVDCVADPFVPPGWQLLSHNARGCDKFEWDPRAIRLMGMSPQKHRIIETLQSLILLNANALDFLLANMHRIPEDWEPGANNGEVLHIPFMGTIYNFRLKGEKRQCVRCLYPWGPRKWSWSYMEYTNSLDRKKNPVAVLYKKTAA